MTGNGGVIIKLNKITTSFKNRRGNMIVNMVMWMIIIVFVVFAGVLTFSSFTQTIVYDNLKTISANMSTTIAVNGKFDKTMGDHYKAQIDKNKFFTGSYYVRLEKYAYSGGSFTKTRLGTFEDGNVTSSFSFEDGETVRVVIYSKDNTKLGKVLQIVNPSAKSQIAVASESLVDR